MRPECNQLSGVGHMSLNVNPCHKKDFALLPRCHQCMDEAEELNISRYGGTANDTNSLSVLK